MQIRNGAKCVKMSKNNQKFLDKYQKKWPCLQPSKRGEHYAHCTLCLSDFSVKHSGEYDIKSHLNTTKHKDVLYLQGSSHSLFNFIKKDNDTVNSVIKAECLMTNFLIEHNLPISMSDHITPLMKAMFPDSSIASSYSCKQTKSSFITHTMAEECQKQMSELIKSNPFSLSTDGSSDRGAENQLYPMVIRFYGPQIGRILTGLLALPPCTGASTGENIFNLMDTQVKKHSEWTYCISYGSDNAAVMMGEKKGVAAFVLKKNKDIFVTGCTCHLIHLSASKAALKLSVKVDELLIDIFYYLEQSSKRKKMLAEFQSLHGADTLKILKHCSTRWLSLESCVTRLLEQWLPLTHFFDKESYVSRNKKRKTTDEDINPSKAKKAKKAKTGPEIPNHISKGKVN